MKETSKQGQKAIADVEEKSLELMNNLTHLV